MGRKTALALLVAFYALAGAGHFAFTAAMARIVPDWIPAPRAMVIATGVAELVGALALLHPRTRHAAGSALAAYALCVWPANVEHARLDLTHGTGLPLWYHGLRLALQPVIIWWALWASGAIDWPFRRRAP